jgi:hypothetical protein
LIVVHSNGERDGDMTIFRQREGKTQHKGTDVGKKLPITPPLYFPLTYSPLTQKPLPKQDYGTFF